MKQIYYDKEKLVEWLSLFNVKNNWIDFTRNEDSVFLYFFFGLISILGFFMVIMILPIILILPISFRENEKHNVLEV